MPRSARSALTALPTVLIGLSLGACGGAASHHASVQSDAEAPARASSAVTDGRTGPAVTVDDVDGLRKLATGGRADASQPARRGGRTDGIGAGDACTDTELMPSAESLDRIQATTLCLLNGVRADDGLRPLVLNAQLSRAARSHSEDMVGHSYFAHEGRNGSQVKDRIELTGYLPKSSSWTIGENLAWGTGALATPKAIMNAWMNSKGHRDNILKAAYREIGFGILIGNPADTTGHGATYTTEFGARGTPSAPAADAPSRPASPTATRAAAKRRAAAAKARRARRARARLASAKRASARRARESRAAAR